MTSIRSVNDRPWWATFVVNVGVPAAISLFLIYWVTGSLERRVTNMEQVGAQTLAMMNEASRSMHEFAMTQEQKELHRERLLRQICINTSKPETTALCGQ